MVWIWYYYFNWDICLNVLIEILYIYINKNNVSCLNFWYNIKKYLL